MFSILISLPDTPVASLDIDPNQLDALRQTILLGLDFANDLGLETSGAYALLDATRDFV